MIATRSRRKRTRAPCLRQRPAPVGPDAAAVSSDNGGVRDVTRHEPSPEWHGACSHRGRTRPQMHRLHDDDPIDGLLLGASGLAAGGLAVVAPWQGVCTALGIL